MFVMKCDVCGRTIEIDRDNPGDSIREQVKGDWRQVEDFDGNTFDICHECNKKGHVPAILKMEENGYWERTSTHSLLFHSHDSVPSPTLFGVNVHVVAIEVKKRDHRRAINQESQDELNCVIRGTGSEESELLTTEIDGKPHIVWVAPHEV
jgi:hypothetical protein